MKGAHDYAIMSISMALYAGDICFNQLQRNESANKAMLESWTVSERTYEPNKSFYSYGSSFDPVGLTQMDNPGLNTNMNNIVSNKESYQEYSWLFGRKKNL
jgi:hypothetical protein